MSVVTPRISIVVPVYNMEPFVGDCLNSILRQEGDQEFEVMQKAISGLGEPCKSLLEAFYIRKRNMQEIATDFGYTNAENAKTQKYKCLIRLKKIFFSHYKNGTRDE